MPVILGVAANMTVPKVCRKVEPFCPLVGVAVTVILVGASVAQCSRVRFHPLAAVRGSSDWGPPPHAHLRTSWPPASRCSGRCSRCTCLAALLGTGCRALLDRRVAAFRRKRVRIPS